MAANKNIAFLFGAGISIPAGYPSTTEISDQIFDGYKMVRIPSGYIMRDDWQNFQTDQLEYVSRVVQFIKKLKCQFCKFYEDYYHKVNYEDIYYLIDQINQNESGNLENPISDHFRNFIIENWSNLFESITDYIKVDMSTLTREALNYIEDTISILLDIEPKDTSHLTLLNEVDKDKEIELVHIFTLNHDKLIETHLSKNKLSFSEGFVLDSDNERVWDPKSFNERFRIYKLHGSLNWYQTREDSGYSSRVIQNTEVIRDSGNRLLLLIGTHNKLNEYSRGVAFELQHLFYDSLENTDRVIISGYSFGDQGINTRLINWIFKSQQRKIILIHPDPEKLRMNTRGAINLSWDELMRADALRIIPNYIEDVTWSDIKNLL